MAMRDAAYKSTRGRNLILAAHERNLKKIDPPWSSREVQTSWGRTWVLEAGPPDAPPLLFLHGISLHAAAQHHEINGLAKRFRVFAPDIPGQPGLSAERTLPFRGPAFGQWARDLLDALGLETVRVAGYSMGGYAALRLAEAAPERVERAALIVPLGLAPGRLAILPQFLLTQLLYRHRPSHRWLSRMNRLLASPGEDLDPVMSELLGLATLHFHLPVQPIPVLSRGQLARYDRPTLVLVAEHDCFWHAHESMMGAWRLLSRPVVELLRGQGHVPASADRDANAVRVEWQGHKLGYVPRRDNAAVARHLDRGGRVEARVSKLKAHRNPWQRVEFEVFVGL